MPPAATPGRRSEHGRDVRPPPRSPGTWSAECVPPPRALLANLGQGLRRHFAQDARRACRPSRARRAVSRSLRHAPRQASCSSRLDLRRAPGTLPAWVRPRPAGRVPSAAGSPTIASRPGSVGGRLTYHRQRLAARRRRRPTRGPGRVAGHPRPAGPAPPAAAPASSIGRSGVVLDRQARHRPLPLRRRQPAAAALPAATSTPSAAGPGPLRADPARSAAGRKP